MQYIFDMDGTLIDSMPTFGRVMVDYLRANGVAYPPDVVERVTPLGFSGTAEYFIGELGVCCARRWNAVIAKRFPRKRMYGRS